MHFNAVFFGLVVLVTGCNVHSESSDSQTTSYISFANSVVVDAEPALCNMTDADWNTVVGSDSGHNASRRWNEMILALIRRDIPMPGVHARNLHTLSLATYEIWASVHDEPAAVLKNLPKWIEGDIEQPTTHYSENDIALISLVSDIPEFVRPVALANDRDVGIGSEVILAGYGINEFEMQLENLKAELSELNETLKMQLSAESQERLSELMNGLGQLYLSKDTIVANLSAAPNEEDRIRMLQEVDQIDLDIAEKAQAHALLQRELISELNDPQFLEMEVRIARQESKVSEKGKSGKVLREVTTTIDIVTDDNVIIYKSENGLNSGCFGDSGGPMYFLSKKILIQVGVTHGPYLGSEDSVKSCQGSGVYTNVARFRDFIAGMMTQSDGHTAIVD